MKKLLFISALLFCLGFSISFEPTPERNIATSKVVKETRQKVMVIDTGIIVTPQIKPYLCTTGHKSYIYGQNPLTDLHGHGTNVAGLIALGMNPKKQCLLIVKFWDANMGNTNGMELVRAALRYAIKIKPAFINMSLGGDQPDHLEMGYIKTLIKQGTKIAVAAGNNHQNLNISCNYFPACYNINNRNFRVVGSNTSKLMPLQRRIRVRGKHKPIKITKVNGKYFEVHPYSNFGSRVTHWEDGTEKGYRKFHGTSQATAISMSKWVQGK